VDYICGTKGGMEGEGIVGAVDFIITIIVLVL